MKTITALLTLIVLALPSMAQPQMKPLDKDIPLAEGIHQANALFSDMQPLTEQEVIAAVKAIKLTNPDMKQDIYDTYIKVVKDRVLPRGMYFNRITAWNTEYGRFQVDWMDLCLEGHVATAEEKQAALSKMPANMTVSGEVRVGGFEYRLRSQFIK